MTARTRRSTGLPGTTPGRLVRGLFGVAAALVITACTSDPDESTGTPATQSASSSATTGESIDPPSSAPTGETPTSEAPAESVPIAPPAEPQPPVGVEESCSLTAGQLSSVTSIGWTFQSAQADQAQENSAVFSTIVCRFVAADLADESGAPAALRVDEFDATYAVLALEDYEGRCTVAGGTLIPAETQFGLATCEIDGQIRSGFRSEEGRGFALQVDGGNAALIAQLVSPALEPLLAQAQ